MESNISWERKLMNNNIISKKILKTSIYLIITVVIINFFAYSAAAYYKPTEYRKSLLKIRDVEKAIYSLEKDFKKAEDNFKIIAQTAESDFAQLNDYYQETIKAYEKNNQEELDKLSALIIKKTNELKLKLIESKPVQVRAFWLDSGTFAKTGGREGLKELLDLPETANFNLVFPEVYYKGMSVIPTNQLFQQDPRFKDWDEDPLKVLIEEAKKRNLEVHPWVWVFNENTSGEAGRILKKHPEWANKNKEGQIVTYHNSTWLSPARDDVKSYLQKRYKFLVENYDIQGINLDYIRFPEEYRGSFGYDQKSVEKFKSKYDLDPFKLAKNNEKSFLWNKYRENLITEMVKETSEILKNVKPNILISADVIPGIEEARYRTLQNWSLWLEKDYIDFVLPMTYTENLFSELQNWIVADRKKINKPLYAGISVFKLSSEQMIKQLEEINSINPNGMSLFAAAHLKESDYLNLAEGVFSKAALLAHQNKNSSLKRLQNFILKRLELIKAKNEIENRDLIKIRYYLNQRVKQKLNKSFSQFINEENLFLNEEVEDILKSDFNYLETIIKLY